MPKGYPILDESQKQEIIERVKRNGESVSSLAKEYGVHFKNHISIACKASKSTEFNFRNC